MAAPVGEAVSSSLAKNRSNPTWHRRRRDLEHNIRRLFESSSNSVVVKVTLAVSDVFSNQDHDCFCVLLSTDRRRGLSISVLSCVGCLPFEAYLSDSCVCPMRVSTKLIRTAEDARNIGILLCIEHASVPQMPSYPTLHLHQHCLPQLEETPQQKKSEK